MYSLSNEAYKSQSINYSVSQSSGYSAEKTTNSSKYQDLPACSRGCVPCIRCKG